MRREKAREGAREREREKRNGTFDEKIRLSNVRIDRIRRDTGTSAFASGVVSRGRFRARIFFLFFLSRALSCDDGFWITRDDKKPLWLKLFIYPINQSLSLSLSFSLTKMKK